jgi:UDP-glucose 4-epimerase
MKICIVGSSSYIGGWLLDYFVNKNYEIVSFYRNEPSDYYKYKNGLIKNIQGDISNKDDIDLILNEQPDFVIYLISLNHIDSEKNIKNSIDNNVTPLLELSNGLSNIANFKKIVYFSTLQVLGKINPGEIIDEDSIASPLNIYGLTHFFCEEGLKLISKYNQNFKFSIIRLANSFGAPKFASCNSLWLVINDFCHSALSKQEIRLKSDGSPQRDFIHLLDVSRGIEKILQDIHFENSIVNISSGTTMTMLELAHLVKEVFKEKLNVDITILLPNNQESIISSGSNVIRFKINSSLFKNGYNLNMSIKDGIFETIQGLQKLTI